MKQKKIFKKNRTMEVPPDFTGIVEYPDGRQEWLLDGFYHNIDGPATKSPGEEDHWVLFGYLLSEEDHRRFSNMLKVGYSEDFVLEYMRKVMKF